RPAAVGQSPGLRTRSPSGRRARAMQKPLLRYGMDCEVGWGACSVDSGMTSGAVGGNVRTPDVNCLEGRRVLRRFAGCLTYPYSDHSGVRPFPTRNLSAT